MDTKSVHNKLQEAYKSMLEHVEELVDKDKKPLKEAFSEAEEKLSEWRELSREEIDHISDELKSNLSEWGETTHRLNQSLKETLSFDASYIASNVWSKLSKVADQTRLELSELGETLQHNMTTDASNLSDQQQIWMDDTTYWHEHYDQSLKQLDELRVGVRKQMRSINRYSKTISTKQSDEQQSHNRLSQINKEITSSIDNLYQKLHGDD
ncbi:MAG: hypothetical protein V3U71_09650 [Cocleimonas sp.]